MATATRACTTGTDPAYGNHLNRLALSNKMDFAHQHGYELWVHAEKVPLLRHGLSGSQFGYNPGHSLIGIRALLELLA